MNFSPIRLAGSVLSLVTGGVAALAAHSEASSSLQVVLLAVGAVLAIDSLVSFAGIRASFVAGAVLSAAVLGIVAIQWGTYSGTDSAAALALSVLSVVVDAVASRPARGLSEQSNPMNLPVFG
jgi:hypothetical protein